MVVSHICLVLGGSVQLNESLGKHGVAIFFVLSGYLITNRLLREQDRNNKISLKQFYKRRFFRLMPAAWAYLLFISIVTIASQRPFSSIHLPACLLCFRNYVEPTGIDTGTSHFWSLSLEEQFYFVWPTILILAGRKRALWIAIAGALAVAGWRLHCSSYLSTVGPHSTLGAQYRADAILAGCALALLPAAALFIRKWMLLPFILFLSYCTYRDYTLIPLYECVAIALMLLTTVQFPRMLAGRVLESKLLVRIGQLSYSIYLWQEIIFSLRRGMSLVIGLPLLAAAACISYYFIEEPSIQLGKRFLKSPAPTAPISEPLPASD